MSSRLAVCLNSSFLGFYAHAGFMQGLEELGVRPAAVSGASAGALVAGFLAAGKSAGETAALLLQPDLRATLLDWGVPWRALGTLANRPGFTGAVSADRALRLLRGHLGDHRVEACTQPRLALSVTNLTAGRTEVITAGPLAEFILASGAFPGLFAAREVEGAHYWDGGIANPLPFDPWLTDPEIDTILVHVVFNPTEAAVRDASRRLNVAGAFNLSHQIICDELLRWKTDAARLHGKRLIFLRTEAPRPGMMTAHRIGPQCVAAGLATARANEEMLCGCAV
jgi:predicted acylesterase/phospholipase RssA